MLETIDLIKRINNGMYEAQKQADIINGLYDELKRTSKPTAREEIYKEFIKDNKEYARTINEIGITAHELGRRAMGTASITELLLRDIEHNVKEGDVW